jgi:hypothetical protein
MFTGRALSTLFVAALISSAGCTDITTDASYGSEPGRASVNIPQVPAGVRCIRISATATKTVVKNADVNAGQSSQIDLTALALGSNVFTGTAFDVGCNGVGPSTSASWQSDPVTTTITAGAIAKVALVMHPASGGGAAVTVSFDGDGGTSPSPSPSPAPTADAGGPSNPPDGGVPAGTALDLSGSYTGSFTTMKGLKGDLALTLAPGSAPGTFTGTATISNAPIPVPPGTATVTVGTTDIQGSITLGSLGTIQIDAPLANVQLGPPVTLTGNVTVAALMDSGTFTLTKQ